MLLIRFLLNIKKKKLQVVYCWSCNLFGYLIIIFLYKGYKVFKYA